MIYATNSSSYRKFLSWSRPVECQARHATHAYIDCRALSHSQEPIPDDVFDSVYQSGEDREPDQTAEDPDPFGYYDQQCAQVRAEYAKLHPGLDWRDHFLISSNVYIETGLANCSLSAGIPERDNNSGRCSRGSS